MFCPKCGNNMDDNARICSKCGTPVAGNAQTIRTANNNMGGSFSMPNRANHQPIKGNIAGFPVDWRAVTFIGGIVYLIMTIVGLIGMFAFNCWKISMFGYKEAYSLGKLLDEADGEWGFGIFMLVLAILIIIAAVGIGAITVTKVLSDDASGACKWLGNTAIVSTISQLVPIFAGVNFKNEQVECGSVAATPIVFLIIFLLMAVAAKFAAKMIADEEMRQSMMRSTNQ